MSNKLKNRFTGEMIKRSKVALGDNTDFAKDLKEYFESPEMANLTPEEHSHQVMYFFQDTNFIRPEILLDRDNELSKIVFKDEASFKSFESELSNYQDDEQVLLSNRKNGMTVSELALDENNIMPFKDPIYAMEVDEKNVKVVGKLLDKSYDNVGKLGGDTQYEMFSNENAFMDHIDKDELEKIEDIQFEPLKQNTLFDLPESENTGLMIGAAKTAPVNSLVDDLANLDKFQPTAAKTQALEADTENNPMTMKARMEAAIQERISKYEIEGNTVGLNYGIEGKRKFNVETSLTGVDRAYGGMSPDSDTIVDMLLVVDKKNILQFPYSEENVASFKEAMMKIKEDELFDLKEIRIHKDVDPAFKKALDEVMNAQLVLGEALDNDEQEAKNEAKSDVKKDDAKNEAKSDVKKDDAKNEAKSDVKKDDAKNEAKSDVKKDDAKNEAKSDVKKDGAKNEAKSDVKKDGAKNEAKSDVKKDGAKNEAKSDVKKDDAKNEAKGVEVMVGALANQEELDEIFNIDGFSLEDFDEDIEQEEVFDDELDMNAVFDDEVFDDELDMNAVFDNDETEQNVEDSLDVDLDDILNENELEQNLELESNSDLDKTEELDSNVDNKSNNVPKDVEKPEVEKPVKPKTALEINDDARSSLLADIESESIPSSTKNNKAVKSNKSTLKYN